MFFANLSACILENNTFKNCNMEGTLFSKSSPRSTSFTACNMIQANLSLCFVEDISLKDCDLDMAIFAGSIINNSSFRDCNMQGLNLVEGSLENSTFKNCDLSKSILLLCFCLGKTSFVKCNMTGVVNSDR